MKDYTYLQWMYSSSSSGGQYLKAVDEYGDKKYYYKLSDYSYGTFRSHESVLEVISSRLGINLGLPVLKYTGELAKIMIDGEISETFVTRSLNYCSKKQTAIPLVSYYNINKKDKESPLDFCRRTGLTEFIDQVMIFDYLIMNVDRHGKNIELLISDNEIIPAPIFDSGRCLTHARGNRIENILQYDYKEAGQGNNFIGSINLERNLTNVSRQYILKRPDDKMKSSVFYGLGKVIDKRHKELIWEAILYRYEVLITKGVIIPHA